MRRANNNITVAVYSDLQGEYFFPNRSDVKAGVYVADGKTKFIDFTLKSKQVAYEDAVISEIVAGLPGTEHQEVLFSQRRLSPMLYRLASGVVEAVIQLRERFALRHSYPIVDTFHV